ncbi:MAG: hypothetical protein CMC96_04920 [Flavobacteriales bacterium]|nr:hypothetical protein [Flavobacteriales bacterium]
MYNNTYSLWRVNGCHQGFSFVASFGFGGQERASKPPQAIVCQEAATAIKWLHAVNKMMVGPSESLYRQGL